MPRLKYLIPEWKRKYIRKRRAKPWKEVPANRAAVRLHARSLRKHGAGVTRAMRKGRDGQPSWTQPVIEEPEWGSVRPPTIAPADASSDTPPASQTTDSEVPDGPAAD